MATKNDFTAEEWQTLQWAVVDAMTVAAMADPGFWDSFKESTAAAKYIAAARTSADNLLVRDVAGDVRGKRDKELNHDPADMTGSAAKRIREAVQVVSATAPEDLEAFRAFVIGLAEATAMAVDGESASESQALTAVREALGAD